MDRGRSVRAATGRLSGTRLVVLGVVSGLLYVTMYVAQRVIHAGPTADAFTAGLAVYPVITIGVFVVYAWVLALCRRPLTGAVRLAAFGFPVVYSLFWLAVAPVFSIDVFAYIAHGYVQVGLGDNPYLVHSSAVAASPIGAELASYGWRPVHPATPYGPVLTGMETAVVWLSGHDVWLSMLLFKLVAVGSSLAVAAVIWLILDRVRPQDRDLGTVAYLWNPAVLVEVAGEGHNDSVMTLLAVGTVLLVLQRRVVVGALTMSAAVLTKYVPVLLVPVLVGYLWRSAQDKRSLLWRVAAGVVAGAGVAVALYAPYWAGRQTFAGLGSSGSAGHTGSTQTFLVEILSLVISEQTALRVVSLAAAATVVLAAILITAWVTTPIDLVRGIAVLMVIYTLLSPAYWPWYVVLPVAFLALSPHGVLLVLLVAMSLGSRLVAPLDSLYVDEVIGRPAFFLLTWLGAVGVPLLAVLVFRRVDFGEVVSIRSRRRYGSSEP
jgi:alpha-1,6-mannosyltransferase